MSLFVESQLAGQQAVNPEEELVERQAAEQQEVVELSVQVGSQASSSGAEGDYYT